MTDCDRPTVEASTSAGSQRRSFLARILALGAALGAATVAPPAHALASGTLTDDEPWMTRLRGSSRVIFHSHLATDGLAITWARTFLETQKSVYGKQDADSSVVVGLNGRSIGLLFNDAIWRLSLIHI